MSFSIVYTVFILVIGFSSAEEFTPLDPDYGAPKNPLVLSAKSGRKPFSGKSAKFEFAPQASHINTALAQTPVKSQGRRGTCSIFSSTAILEYHLIRMGIETRGVNLSEQWLEYITAGQRGSEGSWSNYNFQHLGTFGYLAEDDWVYNPTSWFPYKEDYWQDEADLEEFEHFRETCGDLQGTSFFDHCLIGQENPHFLKMDTAELDVLDQEFSAIRMLGDNNLRKSVGSITSDWFGSSADIQGALDQGNVLALDITFFYEAWNHRKASELGLDRDSNLWMNGVVSYPSKESLDYVESRKQENRAGHSVVLVGYDSEIEIVRTVKDKNGQPMEVKSRGVYYFKNSWGTDGFGENFSWEGQLLSGFGMISMDYAHEHGSFYGMNIQPLVPTP